VIILDTNVLSALMRQTPDMTVVLWMNTQPPTSIWTTSVTVIRFGLQTMARAKKRTFLLQAFEAVLDTLGRSVAAFDASAAAQAADLMETICRLGRPQDLRDTMIAGIALTSHATLATRNVPHFKDVAIPVIDPWTASAAV
jgi:predicted nucleic acid-binding protein